MAKGRNKRRYGQKQPRDDLTADLVRKHFFYDPETGQFLRKNPRSKTKTHPNIKGYRLVRFRGVLYRVNRLAWLHFHGCWPKGFVDHRNGVKTDNRIENLRDVTP